MWTLNHNLLSLMGPACATHPATSGILELAAGIDTSDDSVNRPTSAELKGLVAAVGDGSCWLQQLCRLCLHIKGSWHQSLSPSSKAVDHAPLHLMCSLGVLLSRVLVCTCACSTGKERRGGVE